MNTLRENTFRLNGIFIRPYSSVFSIWQLQNASSIITKINSEKLSACIVNVRVRV